MFWIFILLAVVQGFCEFLPVSSSGHIVLIEKLFNLDLDILSVSIILHLATALSVIVIYRKEILELIKNPFSKRGMLFIFATASSVIFILIFNKMIGNLIYGKYLGFSFFITGLFLLIADYISRKYPSKKPVDFNCAIIMGIFQGIAILPGISRSGFTLCSGLAMNKNKNDVVDFSFILSLPIIFAGTLYDIIFQKPNFSNINIWFLIIAFIVSFLCGLLALKLMRKMTSKFKLWIFSIYLFIIGIITLIIL